MTIWQDFASETFPTMPSALFPEQQQQK